MLSEQVIRNKNTVPKFLFVPLGKIAVAHRGAANADLAGGCGWLHKFNLHALHRAADQTVVERCAILVVANSTAFRSTIKGMNRLLEFFEKLFRHSTRKRSPGRNAQPKLWQGGHIVQIAKGLIKDRRAGKNRCVRPSKVGKNGSRCSIPADHHRHTARDQGRKQITKPIGVRDRDHAKIQIAIGNSHRLANLIAIG